MLALLCVAVARPRIPLSTTADRTTVVLVVDVSISMNAKDVAPTRLEAARAAISSFVDQVPGRVRVGLVAFADDPVVVTAPTTDRKLLKLGIASLTPGFGTAIGDAVARAVELVRSSAGETGRFPTTPRPAGEGAPRGGRAALRRRADARRARRRPTERASRGWRAFPSTRSPSAPSPEP